MNDDVEVIAICDVEAPTERVHQALTDPEIVGEWLESEVPGIGPVERTLVEASPERVRYALRSDDGERVVESEVTFTLTPTPSGGTRVRLVHAGFLVGPSEPVAMRRAA